MLNLKLLSYGAESKVCELAEKYHHLTVQQQQLIDENKELKEKIKSLEATIKMQADDIIRYKLGTALQNEQKYTDVKYKINALMREIDACIHLLNE